MSDIDIIGAPDGASDIALTAEGEAYCERQRRLERRVQLMKITRSALDLVEECIAELDAMDSDPDFEANGDDEPTLGWPAGHGLPQLRTDMQHDDDREEENEHGGDILDERHDGLDEDLEESW